MKEEETYEFYREQTLLLTEEYKELKNIINKAIEQLEELKNLYEDNYTVSDKTENIINILKGEDKE